MRFRCVSTVEEPSQNRRGAPPDSCFQVSVVTSNDQAFSSPLSHSLPVPGT